MTGKVIIVCVGGFFMGIIRTKYAIESKLQAENEYLKYGSLGGIQVLYLSVQHIFSKIVHIEKVIVQIDHEVAGNCNYNVK
jgi:hypothetical protein